MQEDNTFIVNGLPPIFPIPEESQGRILYNSLIQNGADDTVALVSQKSLKLSVLRPGFKERRKRLTFCTFFTFHS